MSLPDQNEDRARRILLLTSRAAEYKTLVDGDESWSRKLFQNHPLYLRSTPDVEVRLTHTGVGPEQTRRVLTRLAGAFQPDLVFPAGTAGALNSSLSSGEVFLPTAVVDRESDRWLYPEQEFLHWLLGSLDELETEAENGLRLRTGPLLTSPDPVLDTDLRTELAERFQAMAVDMETYHQVDCLQQNRSGNSFAWIGLRVISDPTTLTDSPVAETAQAPAARQLGHLLDALVSRIVQ